MSWFQRRSTATALLAIWLVLTTIGCGKKPSSSLEVHGKVTLSDSPVEDAVVTFYPIAEGGQTPTGRTDSEGNFSLRADPGEYKVVVVKYDSQVKGGRNMQMQRQRKSLLPALYANVKSTPLQCTVPSSGTVAFDLASAKKGR